MSRFLVLSLVVCSMIVVSAADAQAGLFGKRGKSRGCAPAPTCCAPAPTCCAPAPTCYAPAPTCCAPAPAPTCCAPAPTCCTPAPSCGGCGSYGSSQASYQGVVTSGCNNCSQTMNSGVIMESAAPEAAPPAPAADTATPTPDAAPSAPAAPAAPAA